MVRDAWHGLIVGVISIAIGAAMGYTVLSLGAQDAEACSSDLVCIPDLGPFIAAAVTVPVIIAVAGPLAARLIELPRPWLSSLPAAWAVVLACVAGGPGGLQAFWPFSNLAAVLLILCFPYGLIAVWTLRPKTNQA